MTSIMDLVVEIRQKLQAVPGRTGILAEERRYSTFDEELIIREFFQDRMNGFFLDVGCAWPVHANNTYYLEKHLGWKGIAIDALPEYAPDWKKERPDCKFFNYLVTDHSGTSDTFFKSPDSGLSSTSRSWASAHWLGLSLKPEEVHVRTITLNDLLEREGVAKIDLLAMDLEGHELLALEGIDLDFFQPELVVVESPSDAVLRHFDEQGYEMLERYVPFDIVNRYFRRRQMPKRTLSLAPPSRPRS